MVISTELNAIYWTAFKKTHIVNVTDFRIEDRSELADSRQCLIAILDMYSICSGRYYCRITVKSRLLSRIVSQLT